MGTADRNTARRIGFARFALLLIATGCAVSRDGTRDGVIAQNDLVSLMLEHADGVEQLRLVPQTGVKISAQFKPTIQTDAGTLVEFDARGRTADSVYFVMPPTAPISGRRPLKGTLRASACPQGKRVCLSVELPVEVR
jgi:hypothetical protein